MPFEIVRNDITNMQVDAIVNAASRYPRVGAGVDMAVHKKAGPKLLEARKEIGYIAPGSAAITPAFGLNADYVIHAATPTWTDGLQGEEKLLRQTYDMCLKLAVKHHCDSIAFPLLASGNHGFSKDKALEVAIAAFSSFLLQQDMHIYLVVFGKESVVLSKKLVQRIQSYIDDRYVDAYEQAMFSQAAESRCIPTNSRRVREERDFCMPAAKAPSPKSLGEFLKTKDAGFTETLLSLIEKSGEKNSTIYKRANLSKQLFSKIINDPDYKPTKPTAIALALALRLDLAATNDLIGRAGYTLTSSSVFDLIIQYFIQEKQYNIVEINLALYEFDQVPIGY